MQVLNGIRPPQKIYKDDLVTQSDATLHSKVNTQHQKMHNDLRKIPILI